MQWRSRPDGKEWDTIKPLARQGFDVRRTILVDNDHYKSASGEEDSMFLMPHWEQEPGVWKFSYLVVCYFSAHLCNMYSQNLWHDSAST